MVSRRGEEVLHFPIVPFPISVAVSNAQTLTPLSLQRRFTLLKSTFSPPYLLEKT
nr:MAG TPA: hypothetical protein [Caudoviricetes sp.]